MIQDIIRAIIQRIFRDKILLGLLIIGILAVFMTGTQSSSEKSSQSAPESMGGPGPAKAARADSQMSSKDQTKNPESANQGQMAAAPTNSLKPAEAVDFMNWWLGYAMDYQAQSAEKNRTKAMGWMTPEAADTFKSSFWTPEIQQGISNGSIVAAFSPSSVQATALNPDGTIVVHVKGTLVRQMAGQTSPSTELLLTDYLIKKEEQGYRVANVHHINTYDVQQAAAPGSYY